jgi:hypothetical protein
MQTLKELILKTFVLQVEERDGAQCHKWGRGEVHTAVWWGDLKDRNLGNLGVNGRIILKWILHK